MCAWRFYQSPMAHRGFDFASLQSAPFPLLDLDLTAYATLGPQAVVIAFKAHEYWARPCNDKHEMSIWRQIAARSAASYALRRSLNWFACLGQYHLARTS